MKFCTWASIGLTINASISLIISVIDPTPEGRQFFLEGMLQGLMAMHFYDWSKK
jgi:hypothetical protein